MISGALASKVTPRSQINLVAILSWKLGVCNRKISERVTKSQSRNASKQSVPPRVEKCKIPEPNDCKPPDNTAKGRANKQPEAIPCHIDCRKGEPYLPVRSCLPWERGVELCPGKQPTRKLESETCQHFCEPYAGQEFINRFKVSACEFRRFQRCFAKTHDPAKCMNLAPTCGLSNKVYPLMHAFQKNRLPGAAIKLEDFTTPESKSDNGC